MLRWSSLVSNLLFLEMSHRNPFFPMVFNIESMSRENKKKKRKEAKAVTYNEITNNIFKKSTCSTVLFLWGNIRTRY